MLIYVIIFFLIFSFYNINILSLVAGGLLVLASPRQEKLRVLFVVFISFLLVFPLNLKMDNMQSRQLNHNQMTGYAYRVIDNHFEFYDDKYSLQPVLVYSRASLQDIEGCKVKITGLKKIIQKTRNKNSFDFEKHILAKGYKYGLYANDVKVISDNADDLFLRRFVSYVSQKFIKNSANLSPNARYIYNSLFLGRNSKESITLKNASELGLVHLFVISGFHFAIIISVLMLSFRFLSGRNFVLARVLVLLVVILYYFIIGGGFGATRVVLMLIFSYLAFVFRRKLDKNYLLFVIAFILIVFNPFVMNELGFVLTFTASLTLLHISKSEFIKGLNSSVVKNLILTILVSITTAVFLSLFNGDFIPISIVILPFAGVILELLTVIFLFYSVLPFLSLIFVPIIEFIAGLFSRFLLTLSSLKEISYYIPRNLAILLAILIIYLFIRKLLVANGYQKINLAFTLSLVLLLAVLNMNFNQFEMTIYDLRDGEAYLIKTKKSVIVYDVGNDLEIVKLLRADGVRKIDLLMISHADQDHYGMLDEIYKNFEVKKVVMKNEGDLQVGDVEIKFAKINSGVKKRNDLSLVALVKYQKFKFLLTGDIEEDGVEYICRNLSDDVDLLKAPHHGSYPENFSRLLAVYQPEFVTISGGRGKRIKKDKTYQSLQDANIKYYDTMLNGEIRVKISNGKLKFSVMKE